MVSYTDTTGVVDTPALTRSSPTSPGRFNATSMPTLVYTDRILSLDDSEVILGRHRECTIQVDDEKASRRHARLFIDQGIWWIEDLESANGTTVNSRPLKGRRKLAHEDTIGIGKSRLQYHDQASAPAEPVREKRSSAAQGVAGNPELLIGRTVGGYVVKAVLGKNPMGATYRARQTAQNRDVALRVFSPEVSQRADFAERLQQAVRKAATVKQQYLLQIYESGRDDELGSLWYSMELADGDSLAKLLTRDGTIAPGIAGLVVERSAMALGALHDAGVVHGDVHPRTVLLTPSGQVKVCEAGLASALAVGRGGAGDLAYHAPDTTQDARSDIYSLGCMFFSLLTGKPPYSGDTPEAVAKAHSEQPIPNVRDSLPKLPTKLDELIHGMLAKNPEWRFASVKEVLAELTPLRVDLAIQPAPVRGAGANSSPEVDARIEEVQSRRRRNSVMPAIIWIVILGAVAVGVSRLPFWSTPAPGVDPTVQQQPSGGIKNPAAVASTPTTPGSTGTAAVDAHADAWRTVQVQVDADAERGDWGAAERALVRFAATPGLSPTIASAVQLAQSRLQVEGEAWYQKAIAALPTDLTAALAQLSHLRDVAITSERGDADARYSEVQERLLQRLNAARRAARQAVESGKSAELPALASGLEAAFHGTPIAGLQRQFATACNEAAPAARLWQGTWPTTKATLIKATGANALPAAAALLLAGEVAEAKRILQNDPALQAGDMLRRREALLGREAAVLTFNDPGDLQFIESSIGDLRFDAGALSGPAGDAVAFACTVPVGGADWDVSLVLHLANAPGAQAQAVIAAMVGETAEASVRISNDGMLARIHAVNGWQQQVSSRPTTAPLHLRLVSRGGTVQVMVNGESVMEVTQARVPTGAHVSIDVSGATWSLDELHVVGGE